jgi:hypothetical protein
VVHRASRAQGVPGGWGTDEDVARLLSLLERHAQGEPYFDDVTVASIAFEPA